MVTEQLECSLTFFVSTFNPNPLASQLTAFTYNISQSITHLLSITHYLIPVYWIY